MVQSLGDVLKLIWWAVIALFRLRASLEADILALRHQLTVLRRKTPKRLAFSSFDRLVFASLYSLILPSPVGAFCHFGPCGAGFGRRSLVAIFQFPFRWGRDRFDCGQGLVRRAPLGGLVGADAAAINERTFVFRRMYHRGQRRQHLLLYVTIRPSAPARSRNRAGPWVTVRSAGAVPSTIAAMMRGEKGCAARIDLRIWG
jgi:hypothetical protein